MGRIFLPERKTLSSSQVFLQGGDIQISPQITGPTGPGGSHTTGSGIHHLHMQPIQWCLKQCWTHLRMVAPSYLYRRGASPGSKVMVKEVQHVLVNAIQVSHVHHHYYHGCKYGRLWWPLHCARVRSCTIQHTVNKPGMPAPH